MPDDVAAASSPSTSSVLEALDATSLDLLGLLALANVWLSRSKWSQLGAVFGIRRPAEQIDRLVDAKLVLTEPLRAGSLRYRVAPAVIWPVMSLLHARGRLVELDGRASPGWGLRGHRSGWIDPVSLETDLRIAALERNPTTVAQIVEAAAESANVRAELGAWMVRSLGSTVAPTVVDSLGEAYAIIYLRELIGSARTRLTDVPAPLIDAAAERDDAKLRLELGRLLILRGEAKRAAELERLPKHGAEGLAVLAAFWAGDLREAAALGDKAVAAMKTRRYRGLYELEGLCHVLAKIVIGIQTAGPKSLASLVVIINAGASGRLGEGESHAVIAQLHRGLLGARGNVYPRALRSFEDHRPWSVAWVSGLHDLWLLADPQGQRGATREAAQVIDTWARRAASHGFAPVAHELEGLRDGLAKTTDETRARSLATALRAPEPWETALAGLDAAIDRLESLIVPAAQAKVERELRWMVKLSQWAVVVMAQVRSTGGEWHDYPAARQRDDDQHTSELDREVLTALRLQFALRFEQAGRQSSLEVLESLIDHPRVVDEQGQPLRVERGHAKLVTRLSDGQLRVTIEPAQLATEQCCWVLAEPSRLLVYRRPPELANPIEIVGRGLVLPERAAERLQRTLTRLSVAVGVELEGDLRPTAEQVVADPRPVLRMSWERETLQIEARVAPLGLDAVWLLAGVGNPALTAERIVDGVAQLVACERDLAEEARRLAQIERECPTLACFGGAGRWSLPTLNDALEALVELGRLGDEIVFAWPAGKPLHPPIERELGDLSVDVRTAGAWLELDAAVLVDEGKVLRLRELIDKREGRFVALGEGRFLALSAALQRRLDALARLDLGNGTKQSLEVSPAMLPVLAELTEELAGASFDVQTTRSLARLRELASARPPRLRGFEARLRDYQDEGYAWMWRLAEAGLGACLADDMGLGKTVQTLALLCQRARKGPALVVCPTSVVHNWVAEAERFAPSLRVAVLADAVDRSALLAAATRRDVVVCSYGLLVSEQQALASVAFATAVFDEAHALKNAKTARAKAARAIQAEFRLGLTGTPVENRVTELWSLFRVLVPGLLGARSRFDERFAKPIARGEREAAACLRAVLRHFILRRTKAAVLDELPSRTEVTLLVPAPPDARAYYEALRRRALTAVEDGDARSKRVRVLAELTRLRQAAVDPRLLDEQAPAGAKIDTLVEQVAALREQGHRALIFTQFLTSMALLRAGFEAAGVEALELDGSTSAAERARRVEAFQAGEADVFVLSLRAGGVGMNLTGADYVFHLDPWWNPAVEDQATDRAHRIGQTRPVTVYRLIGEGTVEAKILELHASKRDLAGDILAGLDEGSDGLELDELMSLLEA